MSYEEEMAILRKKTARLLKNRGMSLANIGEHIKRAMMNRKRFAALWLEHAADTRRRRHEVGKDFAYNHARTLIRFSSEDRQAA